VSVDFEKIQQTFAKDLSMVAAGVARAVDMIRYGSYSDRHPDLGRMVRCPFCRRRHRINARTNCCNSKFATTKRAYDPEKGFHQVEVSERVAPEATIPKKWIRRAMHKRHGQNRFFEVKDLIARLQRDTELLQALANEMNVPVPKMQDIPTFAGKYIGWERKRLVRFENRRAKVARRINKGLAKGGER
jgi:hypothetical protein